MYVSFEIEIFSFSFLFFPLFIRQSRAVSGKCTRAVVKGVITIEKRFRDSSINVMGGNAREMKSNFHRILDRRCVFYDNVVHRFVNETTFVGLPPSFVPRPRRKTVAEKWQKCLGRFPRTKLFHAFPLFFFGVEPRTTFVKLKIVSSIMRLFFFSFHLDRFSAGLWREEERKRRRAIRDRLALFIKVSLARRFPQEIGEIISDNESGLL